MRSSRKREVYGTRNGDDSALPIPNVDPPSSKVTSRVAVLAISPFKLLIDALL